MPTPPNAFIYTQAMDPSDVVDYTITLTQGDTGVEILGSTENVASYTLALTAEAIAAGLQLGTASYATSRTGLNIKFWLNVASGQQASANFAAGGMSLGLELTVVTDSSPARTRQKTFVVTVANQ